MDTFDKDCLSEVISYLTATPAGRLSISCKALSGAFVWNCVRVATVEDNQPVRSGKYATAFSCSSDNDDDFDTIDLSHIWKHGSEIRFTGLRSLEVKHASVGPDSAALLFAQMVAPQLRHFVYGDISSLDINIELNPEIFESGTPTRADVVWKNLRRLDQYPPVEEHLPDAPKLEQLILHGARRTMKGSTDSLLGKAYPSARLVDLGNGVKLDLFGCRTPEDFDAKTREILGFPADRLIYSRCLFWAQLPVDFPAPQKFIDKCHENIPPSAIFATFQEMLLDEFNTPLHLELIDTQLQRSIKSVRRCSEELVMPFIIHTIMQLQTAFFIHKGQFPSPGYPMERARFWMDQFEALFPLRCFDAWKIWLRVTSSLSEKWMPVWFDCCRELSPVASIPFEEVLVPASIEYVKRTLKKQQPYFFEFVRSLVTSDFFPWDLKTQRGTNVLLEYLSQYHSKDTSVQEDVVPLLRGLSSRGQRLLETVSPWVVVEPYLGEHLPEEYATLIIRCFPASIFTSAEHHFVARRPSLSALKMGILFDEALKQMEDMPLNPKLAEQISAFFRRINRLPTQTALPYLPVFVYVSLILHERYGGENSDKYAVCVNEIDFRVASLDSCRRYLLRHIDGSGCFLPERELEIKKQVADALGIKYAEGSVSRALFDSLRAESLSCDDLLQSIDAASDEDLCRLETVTYRSLLDKFIQTVNLHPLLSGSPSLRSIFQRLMHSGCLPTRPCNLIQACKSLQSDPSTVVMALERQPIGSDPLAALTNVLVFFFLNCADPQQLIELLALPVVRKLCRNTRKVVQVAGSAFGSAAHTLEAEKDTIQVPNALLEYLVNFTEPFFDRLHDAYIKCETRNDALSWVEEILLAIVLMDWDAISSTPDKVGKIWRRILMFQDRSGLSDAERLFHTKSSDWPVLMKTDTLMNLSAIYDASVEELRWDYLKMQAYDRKSPMSVVLTSRFSLALFRVDNYFSDRIRESLAAALFPSSRTAPRKPYKVVVDQLSQISKEIDGIVVLPLSLRALLTSSSLLTPSFEMPPSNSQPPSNAIWSLNYGEVTSPFASPPAKNDGNSFPSRTRHKAVRTTQSSGIGSGSALESSSQWSAPFAINALTGPAELSFRTSKPPNPFPEVHANFSFSASHSSTSPSETAPKFSFGTSNPLAFSPDTPSRISLGASTPSNASTEIPARFSFGSAQLPTSSAQVPPAQLSFGLSSSTATPPAPESPAKLNFSMASPSSSSPAPAPISSPWGSLKSNLFSASPSSSTALAGESSRTSADNLKPTK